MSGEEMFKKRKRDEYEGGTMIPAFLQKTYEIMHNQEYSKLVQWNAEKDAIHIIDPVNFAREVLPRYFKHSNFASFVRQLNMYGFHKTKQDPDWREFKHQYFKYGRPDLLQYIKRKSNSGMMKTIPLPDDDLPTQMAELQDKFDTLEQKYSDLQNKHQLLLSRMHTYEINEQERMNKDIITRSCVKFLLDNAIEKGAVTRNAVYQLLTNPRQDNLLTNIDGLNVNGTGQLPLIMNQPCDHNTLTNTNNNNNNNNNPSLNTVTSLLTSQLQPQQIPPPPPTLSLSQQQRHNQQQQLVGQIPSSIATPQPTTAASLLQGTSSLTSSPLSPLLGTATTATGTTVNSTPQTPTFQQQQQQLQQQQQQQQLQQQMQMNYCMEQQPDDMESIFGDYPFSTEHNPNSAFSQPPLQVEEVSTVTHSIPSTPQLDPIASPYLDFDKPSDL